MDQSSSLTPERVPRVTVCAGARPMPSHEPRVRASRPRTARDASVVVGRITPRAKRIVGSDARGQQHWGDVEAPLGWLMLGTQ